MPSDPQIDEFLNSLDHPMKAEIQAVRELVLSVEPGISEGIKWNSMSFRTSEWFLTLNKRAFDRIELVLHLGAKVKENADATMISDPAGLLRWLGKDRALLVIRDKEHLTKSKASIIALLADWIRYV